MNKLLKSLLITLGITSGITAFALIAHFFPAFSACAVLCYIFFLVHVSLD